MLVLHGTWWYFIYGRVSFCCDIMALRNQPYLPLYIQDIMTDEKLNECCAATHGIYIKGIMCLMHKSEEYGKILLKQKYKQNESTCKNFATQLVKHLPYSENEIEQAISELIRERVCYFEGDYLCQKRMIRDNEISEVRAEAGKKGGKNSCFAKAKNKANTKAKGKANTEYEYEYENYILVLKKVLEKNSIILPEKFDELIIEWLKYKSEKGQTYKETGLKALIKRFIKDSGGDIKIGREMLDYSMSQNYTGLFKEKSNGTIKQPDTRNEKRVNSYWDNQDSVSPVQNGNSSIGNRENWQGN